MHIACQVLQIVQLNERKEHRSKSHRYSRFKSYLTFTSRVYTRGTVVQRHS
jgi:hypothetical protein